MLKPETNACAINTGLGYLVQHHFFNGKEEKHSSPFISAGHGISAEGDIIVGNPITNHNHTNSPANINTFKEFLETKKWVKEFIGDKEIWICQEDNQFQVEIARSDSDFSEPWTKRYPDSNGSYRSDVYLSINGNRIKELLYL